MNNPLVEVRLDKICLILGVCACFCVCVREREEEKKTPPPPITTTKKKHLEIVRRKEK